MPLPAVWDPKYGHVYKGPVPCPSDDALSDTTTAQTSSPGVSEKEPSSLSSVALPSPPALADPGTPYPAPDPDGPCPEECLDYPQRTRTNGENSPSGTQYGLDSA